MRVIFVEHANRPPAQCMTGDGIHFVSSSQADAKHDNTVPSPTSRQGLPLSRA